MWGFCCHPPSGTNEPNYVAIMIFNLTWEIIWIRLSCEFCTNTGQANTIELQSATHEQINQAKQIAEPVSPVCAV